MRENKKSAGKVLRYPAVRVALTHRCQLQCNYCPPFGENFGDISGRKFNLNDYLELVDIFYRLGVRQVGFTGGDPFLWRNAGALLEQLPGYQGLRTRIYSNGILLNRYASRLKHVEVIKVGLDAMDAEMFRRITGKDRLKDVLDGVRFARSEGIKIRFNTVLTSLNVAHVKSILDFCVNNGYELKILDLNCFEEPGYNFWKKFYCSSDLVEALFSGAKVEIVETEGGYGIPMKQYKYKGIAVRIKDTRQPAMYAPVCRDCAYFPCQEGIYHMSVTVDGSLKACRHRHDLAVALPPKDHLIWPELIERFLADFFFSAKRLNVVKQVFQGFFKHEN